MNRKKIKSMLVMMGTMLSLNLGSQIEVKALEIDNDKPSLEQKENTKETTKVKKTEETATASEEYQAPKYKASSTKSSDPTEAEVAAALKKINAGTASSRDYKDIGIKSISNDMVSTFNKAVSLTKDEIGRNLSQAEVKDLIKTEKNIYQLFVEVEKGTNDLNQFVFLDISGVDEDNCADIYELLKGKSDYLVLRKDIQGFINQVLDVENAIGQGKGRAEDYGFLKVNEITEDMLPVLNPGMKEAAIDKGGRLNISDIRAVYNKELAKIEAIERLNMGEASLDVFSLLKISNVDENNVEAILHALQGKNCRTVAEIQKVVNDENNRLDLIKKICFGNGTAQEFNSLGLNQVTEANLTYINEEIKKNRFTTLDDIKECVDSTLESMTNEKLINIGKGATKGTGDFLAIGLSQVTDENSSFVANYVKGQAYGTVSELEAVVNEAITYFTAIKDINNGRASLEQYTLINDSTDITEGNRKFLNDHMLGSTNFTIEGTKANIQDVLTLYSHYVKINMGTASTSDYTSIGASKVTNVILSDVNAKLKDQNCFTLQEINTVVDQVIKIADAIDRINSGNGKLDDYTICDEKTLVERANIYFINEVISGKSLKNIEEVKKAVAEKLTVYEACQRIKDGKGELNDYIEKAEEQEVNADNLSFINENMAKSTAKGFSDIRKDIEKALKTYNIIQKVNAGKATVDEYRAVGALNVKAENFEYLNSKLQGGNLTTVDEVQARVKYYLGLKTSLNKINSNNADVSDYENIKVTGVDRQNLLFVNKEVSGNNLEDSNAVQAFVTKAVEIYKLIVNINSGKGEAGDFGKIGAEGVTDKNYHYVISYCSHNENVEKDRFIQGVKIAVNKYNAIQKVNRSSAEYKDYREVLGMSRVEPSNYDYINYYCKTKDFYFDIDAADVDSNAIDEQIQNMINEAKDMNVIFAAVNSGQAKISDYNALDIFSVKDENIKFVNSYLIGKNLREKDDVKRIVDNALADFDAIVRISSGNGAIQDYDLIIGKNSYQDESTGKTIEESYVTVENINFINSRIKRGNVYTTRGEILAFVKEYIIKFQAFARVKNGTATVRDYNEIFNIQAVNDTNLEFIKDSLVDWTFDSERDIENAINLALDNYAAILRINEGHGSEADFEHLGIKNLDGKKLVDNSNINFVNSALKDFSSTKIEDVKNAVKEACQKYLLMETIKAGQANVNTFKSLQIDAVNSANINYMNDVLKGHTYRTVDALNLDAINFADDYTALVNIENGIGTIDNFKRLGVGGITEQNINYVSNDLANKGYYRDGINAVKNAVSAGNTSVTCFNAISMINTGEAKLRDYTTVNAEKASENNIQYINANIKGLNIKTISQIQFKVAELAEKYTSYSKINAGIAVANDYANLDVKIPDASLIYYINNDLANKNILTSDKLQEEIDNHMPIYSALKNMKTGIASLDDFTAIGSKNVKKENLEFLNMKLPKEEITTADVTLKKVELLLAKSGCYGKINAGTAELSDYETAGITGVDEYNIKNINSEIKGTVDIYGNNIQSQVSMIVSLYGAVQKVNDGGEEYDANGIVKQYDEICGAKIKFDTQSDSMMNIIQRCIQTDRKILNGKSLTKSEIKEIITKVMTYFEDAKVVMNRIHSMVESEKQRNSRDLTSDEEKKIITDLMNSMKQTISKVVSGEAKVVDYISLGENQMTSSLAEIVSADIKDYHTVTSDSQYRINKLTFDQAITRGNAILNINTGKATQAGGEYAAIGYNFNFIYDTEKIKLVNKVIEISRALKDGAYLKRAEILNIIADVNKYQKDIAEVMPLVESAIETAKAKNGGVLPGEKVRIEINTVLQNRKTAVTNIVTAGGTLEDFKHFGETRVTNDNLRNIINTDINNYKTVRKLTEYRIEGLTDAVTKGIAVYEINDPKGEINVENFKTIGIEVIGSQDELSEYRLIEKSIELERRIKNNDFLTRTEISSIVDEIRKEIKDKKVLIPKISNAIIKSERNGNVLDAEGVENLIKTVESDTRSLCKRIVQGVAKVEDYIALGKTNVNEDNINEINTDVKENKTITSDGSYRLKGLDDGVSQGISICYINNNCNDEVIGHLSNISITVQPPTAKSPEFKLLESNIKLQKALEGGKRSLTRREIKSILASVREDIDDMQAYMPKIEEEISAEERSKGTALTAEETKNAVTLVKERLRKACDNIVKGQGILEDFAYLGKTKVKEENIKIINRDISNEVSKESSYRLKGLDKAIDLGLAIYSVNINSDESVGKDFNTIGLPNLNTTTDPKKFNLVCSQIRIKRLLSDNKFLDRQEILDIEKSITNDLADQSVIIPRIITEINKFQREKQKEPDSKETMKIKEEVENKIKEVCKDIVNGDGTVDEFKYLGEARVDEDNIAIINRDIKNYRNILLRSNYRVEGLEDAVTKGLAVYSININNDQTISDAYTNLSRKVDYSTAENSMFNLVHLQIEIERAKRENEFLTRSEILEIVDKYDSQKEDLKVTIPAIYEALEAKKNENKDKILTTAEVNSLIEEVQNNIKGICNRVKKGKGTLKDFEYLKETRVNANNIDVINKDIELYERISLVSSYRLKGLDDAVKDGLAVYKINNDYDEGLEQAFTRLNLDVKDSSAEREKCSLLKSMIKLKSRVKGDKPVDRSEIIKLIEEINSSKEDLNIIIPMVNDSIKMAEESGSEKILGEACENIEKDVRDKVRGICSRMVNGEGNLDDFIYFGETAVTKDNLEVVKKDIRDHRTVKLLTSYIVSGLDEAVKKAVSVYKINTEFDSTLVKDFENLDVTDIPYSGEASSKFNLIHSKIKINRSIKDEDLLDREEILNIIKEVKVNEKDLAVTIPKIEEVIAIKEADKGSKIYGAEVEEAIKEAEKYINTVCSNVAKGEGSLGDFRFLGETRVTSDNIGVVNKDIKKYGTVKLISSYRVDGLDDSVRKGIAVYKINNDNDITVIDAFKDLDVTDIKHSTDEKSIFAMIHSLVKLNSSIKNGDPLERDEIKSIINEVKTNIDDLIVTVPKINEFISKKEAQKGAKIYGKEVEDAVKEAKDYIIEVCSKVVKGEGSLEDFKFLGETRVTDENREVINNDIKVSEKASLKTNYRIDGLKEAVTEGLAIYKINNDSDRTVEDALKVLECDAPYSTNESSVFVLIKSKVKEMRALKNGEALNRGEIKGIISEISANKDDLAVIMPKVNELITKREAENGKALTSEETQAIRTEVENTIRGVCTRIIKGQGNIDDFKYLGETRVDKENIEVINADIRESRNIASLTAFRIDGLKDAVTKGLAVYRINNSNDKTIEAELNNLDEKISYSTDADSLFNLVCTKIKFERILNNNKYINRKDLLNIIKDVTKYKDDYAVTLPKIYNALSDKEEITSDSLKIAMDRIDEEVKDIVNKITEGKGTVDDFRYLGENRVTGFNLDVINDDISKYNTITKLSPYRVGGLKEAVDFGLVVYNINKDEANVSDFTKLEIDSIEKDTTGEIQPLVEAQIRINKLLSAGKNLNRDDIRDAVKEVYRDLEDKKVLLPEIESEINKREGALTATETEDLIETVKHNISKICKRVIEGKASYDDYVFFKDQRVTTKNYEDINGEIGFAKSVTKLSSYRIAGLDNAITNAIAINEINEGVDKADASNFSRVGVNLTYSTSGTSLYQITKSALDIARRINGKNLIKGEIREIAKNVEASFADALVVIPAIEHAINDAEKTADKPLDKGEVSGIADRVRNEIRQTIDRICTGEATVDDYHFVGERRINENNIDIANAEVKEYKNITAASKYRINSIENAMKIITTITNINDGNLTYNYDTVSVRLGNDDIVRTVKTNYRVKEFEELGKIVEKDLSPSSELSLIKQAIKILKITKGRPLTRSEILYEVIDEVKRSMDDSAVMIPLILNKLNDEQTKQKTPLTAEQAAKFMQDEIDLITEAATKIYAGEANVDHYRLFGCTNVDKYNYLAVNADILENKTIRKISDYRLENLKEAVRLGLAVYNINQNNVSKNAEEYTLLGAKVDYSDSKTSRFRIIQGQISIEAARLGRMLTRKEILSCVEEVTNDIEDKTILVPKIVEQINKEKALKKNVITPEAIDTIVEEVENARRDLITRVYYGENTTIADYKALGENRVNLKNLETVNKHIAEKLTMLSEYRVEGLTNEVTKAIALYAINNDRVVEGSNNCAKEYADLGLNIKYDNGKTSDFRIVQDYMIINRRLKNNEDLDEDTIQYLFDEVVNDIESYRKIVPMEYEELRKSENTGAKLGAEDTQTIITKCEEQLDNLIDRIIKGNAELADYKKYGENRVKLANKSSINDFIKEDMGIRRTGRFTITGLEESVTKALALYNINLGNQTTDENGLVSEFKTLGLDIARSEENGSDDWLIMTYIKIKQRMYGSGRVNLDDIVTAFEEIQNNKEKAKAYLQKTIARIQSEENNKNVILTCEQVILYFNEAREAVLNGVSKDA